MRVVTERDKKTRERTKALLSHLWEQYELSDTAIATRMLSEEQREELWRHGGSRRVAQDAPRKSVKAWRLGEKTLTAPSAFALGEALHSKIPEYSGLRMLYELDYGADLARTLIALSRQIPADGSSRSRLDGARDALTLYATLRLFNVEKIIKRFSQYASVEDKQSEIKERIRKCEELLKLSYDPIAHKTAWNDRSRSWGKIYDIPEGCSTVEESWLSLSSWAFQAASWLMIATQNVFLGIVLVSTRLTAIDSPEGAAEDALLSALLGCFPNNPYNASPL